jgi:hypothetical protein
MTAAINWTFGTFTRGIERALTPFRPIEPEWRTVFAKIETRNDVDRRAGPRFVAEERNRFLRAFSD